jgi:transcriptional regulator with GAF, ATPase, and Fis domain
MRLAPRIKADLPVTVEMRLAKSEAKITDLSINGAFVKGRFQGAKVGDGVLISYHLPQYGLFEHNGRAIRKDTGGMAITFHDVHITTKTKLWEYVTDNIKNLDDCPYCGEKYDIRPSVCKKCGWGLVFDSPGYFEYYEKMHLLKRLYSGAESLEADQIRRLINFLDVEILKRDVSEEFQEFVGTSAVMKEIFSKIRKVAPTDIPVLILGESGTGKELTALAIHERSTRRNNAFLPINCAAIPESLLEAELFGYERGAFTGAYTSKKGRFEQADGGTLFLDEIGELYPNLQAKLLRFLENQIVERIGAGKGRKVNVRVIAATNCNLESAIENGKFRKDLYYRLSTFPIDLPPVRERDEDGVVLARYFLKRFSRETGVSKEFTVDAINAIRNYGWPGNVREIINKVRRAIIMASDRLISPQDLDLNIQETILKTNDCIRDVRENIEKQKLKEVLDRSGKNISKAARTLGISRPTIYYLKKKYGI